MKKILTIAFLMSFALVAKAEIFSGTCGTNLTWSLNTADSTLTISGTGAMNDYGERYRAPWYRQKEYIKYVNVPNGVTTLGAAAFMDCRNMTSFVIPNTVTKLGSLTFYRSGITSINIPASVTSIHHWSFCDCLNLESFTVAVANTAYCAENGVLYNKAKNTLVRYPCALEGEIFSIPSNVTSIGNSAFRSCNNLVKIVIPASVTSYLCSIYLCERLTSIEVNSNNTKYCSQNGVLFNKDKTSIVAYPSGKTDFSYIIPSTVKTVEGWCFTSNQYLQSLTIPNGVTTINGNGIFHINVKTIDLPASVTNIANSGIAVSSSMLAINVDPTNPAYCSVNGVLYNKEKTTLVKYPAGKTDPSFVVPVTVKNVGYYAFSDCTYLKSISLPTGLSTIAISAFCRCSSLLSINIPASVTSLGDAAFDGCASLLDIIMNTPTPPSVGTDVFYDSYDKALAVPCGATPAYRPDPIFGQFENIIEQCNYNVTVNSANPAQGSASGGGTNLLGGSVIELIATPAAHYHFTHWSDGNTQNPRNYLVEGNATVSAFFAIDKHTITLYAEDCATPNTITNIPYGESIILTADATSPCHRFLRWSDGNTSNPRTVTVTGNATYTAIFENVQYTVTTAPDNAAHGSTEAEEL